MNRDAALDEAILNPDLRHINFFNGRLLTGGDLQAEQSVQHTHARHLGLAVGPGVAEGLRVSEAAASPSGESAVVVTAGTAVNRAGETLRLESDQRVILARPPDPTKRDQCVFADCENQRADSVLGSGTGFYVLTISSASRREGSAPVSGLGNGIATCNSRYFSEGVMFRLLPLTLTGLPGNTALVRSFVAHKCLGLLSPTPYEIVVRASQGLAPVVRGYEMLMPSGRLSNADVPLAVIEWTGAGLGFVDEWSVRRRLARPSAEPHWGTLHDDRRVAEGEAAFAQFQGQLMEMLVPGNGSTRSADQDFAALPPVGLLPIRSTDSPTGIDVSTFLGSVIMNYGFSLNIAFISNSTVPTIKSAQIGNLLAASFRAAPVESTATNQFTLYLIRESLDAVQAGEAAQLLGVFVSRDVPWVNSYYYS